MAAWYRSAMSSLREYFSLTVAGPCTTIREQRRRPKGGAPVPKQKRFSILETVRKQRQMMSPEKEGALPHDGSGQIVHVESVTAHYLKGGIDRQSGKPNQAGAAPQANGSDGESGGSSV